MWWSRQQVVRGLGVSLADASGLACVRGLSCCCTENGRSPSTGRRAPVPRRLIHSCIPEECVPSLADLDAGVIGWLLGIVSHPVQYL